jgi:uncharacterized protein (DUF2141 family)
MEIMPVFYLKKLNNRKTLLTILMLLASMPFSEIFAQETFSVEGFCTVEDTGYLYVYIVDYDTFKVPSAGVKVITCEIVPGKSKGKKIPFTFEGIQEGVYGIRCFIDTDGNKKLNRGIFGPGEPWGMSFRDGRVNGIPSFSDISFKVNSNIENIIIQIK